MSNTRIFTACMLHSWARDNYRIGDRIPAEWPPEVIAECERMNESIVRTRPTQVKP